MNKDDQELARKIAAATPADPEPPAFSAVWAGAEAQHRRSRRQYAWVASAAVLVATLVVVLDFSQSKVDTERHAEYLTAADLLESTLWEAPSDALMPEYQFDIYQEVPLLIQSTTAADGALL